jgi:ATP-dependent helicase/nuclease subunit A
MKKQVTGSSICLSMNFRIPDFYNGKTSCRLVMNALGSGFMTLIVGDAKQSIYRWRGGNMNLLIRDIFTDLNNFKSIFERNVLDMNYRSKYEIVHFNNQFFLNATEIVERSIEHE